MKKRHLLFIALAFASLSLTAAEISRSSAEKAAVSFITNKSVYAAEATKNSYSVREVIAYPDTRDVLYYIINLEPQGWVVVSADDAVPPVLAYSFEGAYSLEDSPSQCVAWMKQYEDQIKYSRTNPAAPYSFVSSLWNDVLRPSSFVIRNSRSVAPLITSNWNQDSPYNAGCPADPMGPGGHAYAGCVPTCMGQVMYYFRWPETGTGSYSYYDSTYGTLSANFDTTHYNWNQMTDEAETVNPAIATLLYHLGVSCDLVYGPNGSGMYNHKAAYSLRTFFKYSPETQYLYRDSTTLNWDSVLTAHLDRKIPMYYAGWSVPNIDGHAFVCDGYQDSCFFHFNFGWSGSNNGYFYTSDLTPGGYNFQLAQEVIINCYPDTSAYTYPVYCSGDTDLKYMAGTFDDGSGHVKNYQPNAACSWLIDPQTGKDSVSGITITFSRFSTNPGDEVHVYDGATASAPLIASLSGDTLPPAIHSGSNKVLVTFNSSMGPPGQGFFASYEAETPVWCSGTNEIVADTAEFTDGSFDFDYHNGQICKWKVTKASGGPLTLYFRSFDTEQDKDFLKIYDFGSGTLVAQYSGQYGPDTVPPPVTVESGTAFLIFTSNSSMTGGGWEVYYPKSTQGMKEKDPVAIKVFPNPATGAATVSIASMQQSNGVLRISDMTGVLVREIAANLAQGANLFNIDISGLVPGMYLVVYTDGSSSTARKLVVY